MTTRPPQAAYPAAVHPPAAHPAAPYLTPAYPAGAQPASIGRRVGAFAIDVAIAYVIAAVLIGVVMATVSASGLTSDPARVLVAVGLAYLGIALGLLAWGLVYAAMQGGRGSLGQRALGLRLQDASAPAPIGFWRAVLRNVVWGLAGSIVVGYFTPLFDSSGRRQGWHDLAARAIVIDGRGTAPEPVPAVNPHLASPAAWPSTPAPATPVPVPASAAAPVPAAASVLPAATPRHAQPPIPELAPAPLRPAPASSSTTTTAAQATRRPPAAVSTGLISEVPWLTEDSQGAPIARAAASALTEVSTEAPWPTTPLPAATTTEPLGVPARVPPADMAVRLAAPTASAPASPAQPVGATAPQAGTAPVMTVGPAAWAASTEAADDDLESTRLKAPVPVSPPAVRAALYPEAPVITVLTWDDGTRMAVYGRSLYGRNPAAEDGAVAISVRDETLSLSKTHFEIGGDAHGAWIADRHSTNGTLLVRDGGRIPLAPGVATGLRAGDRLEFGDRSAVVSAA